MQLDLGLNLGIYNEFRKALDFLSVQSSAAYSLRKLRNAYTGSAIRVRRSLDNAEADIGFSGTDLDTTALTNFVGSQNLLQHSEAFDNAIWEALPGSAETVNANNSVAPDGTTTADTCTITTAISGRFQYLTLASAGQITFSVYVKSGGNGTWVRVGLFDQVLTSNQVRCWVNMSTGTLGTVNSIGTGWSGVSATSTSVGNGWYRVSITATCTVTAISTLITNANADGDVNRTIGQNRILWGAQLNTGNLQPYSPTTRRNLLTFTEAFDNAIYSKVGSSVSANSATAPDGSMTADRIIPYAATGNAAISQVFTYAAAVYSVSVYAKADGYNFVQFFTTIANSSGFVNFDLTTGAVTNSSLWSGSAESVGNGWWRLRVTTNTVAGLSSNIGWHVLVTGAESRYPAITTNGTSGIQLWGSQLELGSTVTAYQRVDSSWSATRDGNGFVTTWYDQSGNGRNLTQATAANQPQIVNAGAVVTDSGRPAIQFDGSNDVLSSAAFINSVLGNSALTFTFVSGGTNSSFGWTGNSSGGVGAVPRLYFQRIQLAYNNNSTPIFTPITGSQVLTMQHDGVTTTNAWRNGTSMGTATEPVVATFGGGGFLSVPLFVGGVAQAGFASEAVLFNSALSTTNRQTLERNQGSYYNITVS